MSKHGETKSEQYAAHMELSGSRRAARVFRILIIIVLAFCCGFFIRGQESLMTSLGFNLSTQTTVNPGATVSGSTYDSLSARIAEIQGIILDESVDSYDLDEATTSSINSLLDVVDDEYVRYFDATRYAAYLSETAKTSTVGIGVLLAESGENIYVADVFEDSIAAAQGMITGDVIVSVDGERVTGKTATEVNNAIFRDEGQSVVISWRRPASVDASGGTEFTATMECAKYQEANITSEILDDQVGYIQISQITQNSANLVSEAVEMLSAQDVKALILDLRDCPGGYLTQAVDIANLFISSGTIVQIQTKDGTTTKSASGATITDLPMVVLMNSKTAAAAEVIAAALQDSQRATLVGSTTMGKGSVQVIKELSFGGALRYTAATYKSPKGYAIDQVGVSPDVTVSSTSTTDSQLSIAQGIAESLVSS